MSFNLQKSLALLTALPVLGQLINSGVQQIESIIPNTGLLGQKTAAIGTYITDGVNVALAGLEDAEKLIPVATNFAAQLLTLIENVKTGAITIPAAPTTGSVPPVATAPVIPVTPATP